MLMADYFRRRGVRVLGGSCPRQINKGQLGVFRSGRYQRPKRTRGGRRLVRVVLKQYISSGKRSKSKSWKMLKQFLVWRLVIHQKEHPLTDPVTTFYEKLKKCGPALFCALPASPLHLPREMLDFTHTHEYMRKNYHTYEV